LVLKALQEYDILVTDDKSLSSMKSKRQPFNEEQERTMLRMKEPVIQAAAKDLKVRELSNKQDPQLFPVMGKYGHESVLFCSDNEAGLRAIIAIHSTLLGPALGGTRMWHYASEAEALQDALRLSRGMTYKAAVAGLNLGGGKAVIIGDSAHDKSERLFRAYGRFVEALGGRYITAEDVGTNVQDMAYIRMETSHVVGISEEAGGSGDPSPVTALGVLSGIRACLDTVYGTPDLDGRRVAIQGVGKVGYALAELLHRAGARLTVCDVDPERVEAAVDAFGARVVDDEDFFGLEVDVLAPCALGAILNDETIPQIRAPIIAGSANNQLQDETRHGEALAEREILYAPDYVINAGGLINVYSEIEKTPESLALKRAEAIGDTIRRVIRLAHTEDVPTFEAAKRLADERLAAARS
jgi:leucine dehydrogenase